MGKVLYKMSHEIIRIIDFFDSYVTLSYKSIWGADYTEYQKATSSTLCKGVEKLIQKVAKKFWNTETN